MRSTSQSICSSDNVFATLSLHGKTIVSIYRNQFNSISEIIAAIKDYCSSSIHGLTRLSIRNQTQGWNIDMQLFFKHRLSSDVALGIPPHEGRQYLIPWA